MIDGTKGSTVEILRVRFGHGEQTAPMRHGARDALYPLLGSRTDTLDEVLLVISELVHNVTQHTGGGGELVLLAREDGVLVEVSDGSREAPRVQHSDVHRVGGRGLFLIAAVARDWGVRRTESGKVVWAFLGANSDAGRLAA